MRAWVPAEAPNRASGTGARRPRAAPRIDPQPILAVWRLLERAGMPRDGSAPSIGQILLMDGDALTRRVLADPRIDVYECGRNDIGLTLQGALRPAQIISLTTVAGADNTLAMADHDDHIHVGWRPEPRGRRGPQVGLRAPQWARLIERLGRIRNPALRAP
ncbi:MAG TPA: hypothetical protein VK631_13595 [Solirubrobacteraceae bacterium]|nr:hypothetical protein [Solirubrobacteraceae bacterium]